MAGVDRRIAIRHLLAGAVEGARVEVTGWVKTSRFSKNVSFVHVYDGSTTRTIQVVLDAAQAETWGPRLGIGAAVRFAGVWVKSPGGEQAFEVAAETVEVIGDSDPATYPLQKKATSLEHLREIAHLRPRTNTFQSVNRVRNALSHNIHRYFQERGFLWIHTPIISTADAEGAGEQFHVTAGTDPKGFFGQPSFLTVSGQLEVETHAQAFTDVYTFGPTFRAENSNTARHAAEFWMIEPEICFADLNDVIALAQDFLKVVVGRTLDQCAEDFAFFDKFIEKGVVGAVQKAIDADFARVTWDEAQDILVKSGRTFEYPVGPGTHLQAEHERFLAEEYFQGPVFVTNYPAEQKAFYMRLDDNGRTVSATDLLVPRIGEIIGGSQREERLDVLERRMRAMGLDPQTYWWYLDLRRFGTVPHGGFGLGLERLILWVTGMKNIRDVIPFPRTPGQAGF
jgi:asparaginyl-tRNA synthetase